MVKKYKINYRTLHVTIPLELFEELRSQGLLYGGRINEFVTDAIARALEEAEDDLQ